MHRRLARLLSPVACAATLALLAAGCSSGGGSGGGGTGHASVASTTTRSVSTPTPTTPTTTGSPAPTTAPIASGWQPLALSSNVVASVLAVDPANAQHVYAGTHTSLQASWDGGAHWDDLGALLPGGANAIDAVAFDPAHPGTTYVFITGTAPRLAKTTDDGQSFVALGVNLSNTLLGSITLDPTNSKTVYVAATVPDTATTPLIPQIWRSVDGGTTWAALSPQISGMLITLVVDPSMPTTLYAATTADVNAGKPGGLWKSTDGGISFASVGSAYLGSDPFYMSALAPQHQSLLALDPTNTATVYAAAQTPGGQGSFNVSHDGGVTWQGYTLNGIPADFYNEVLVDPMSPRTLYLSGGNGSGTGTTIVLKSKDGGATWAPIESGFSTTIAGLAGGLAMAPSATRTIYAGFPGAPLYVTTTGGE